MDPNSFVKQLATEQKVMLTQGNGSWHTNAVGNLPVVTMSDGPHGLRKQGDVNNGINDSAPSTCFPTASAIASSWDISAAQRVAEAIAEEAADQRVDLVLGPGVNIKRSPLCGRNFEYFSEDPLLAGEMGASYVRAMQSHGVGCCLKHFAVNSQETDRMTVDAIVDERALREVYLQPFERVVKEAKPYAIMAAYNKVRGVSCTQNRHLLDDILRGEWGFDGIVISDWGACYDMGAALQAGMDLEMPDGGNFHKQVALKAVEGGKLSCEQLDRACLNVARLAQRIDGKKEPAKCDYASHHVLCRSIAAESAVLLKNTGLLPLDKSKRILVVGELAEKPRFQGAGSSHVNAVCKSFLQVLQDNEINFTYAKGYNISSDAIDENLEFEASSLALNCEVVLFFGGLTDVTECEGYDRTSLKLPECQISALNAVAQHNPNIVFVACGGAPFEMPWLNQVKALLHMHLGGEAVSEAAFDLIFGNISPSGRLAESYPLRLQDTPCYNYFATPNRLAEYRESVFVGYRYYNTFDVLVQFPFGYGLSYSEFSYSDLRIEATSDGYAVAVTVKNIGSMAASEVVQVYVDGCECGYLRPKRWLVGFEKVFLQSGTSTTVTVHVDMRAFAIYCDGAFRVVEGKYNVAVCKDVEHVILNCRIKVSGEKISGSDRVKYPTYYERLTAPKQDLTDGVETKPWEIDREQFYDMAGCKICEYTPPKSGQFNLLSTLGEMAPCSRLIRMMLRFVRKYAVKHSPTKSASDPVAKMTYISSLTTPLISLMSVGGVKEKYVLFMLHSANKRPGKAIAALFGKTNID